MPPSEEAPYTAVIVFVRRASVVLDRVTADEFQERVSNDGFVFESSLVKGPKTSVVW